MRVCLSDKYNEHWRRKWFVYSIDSSRQSQRTYERVNDSIQGRALLRALVCLGNGHCIPTGIYTNKI